MTDKSAFSESEWHALTDAPLLITAAVFIPGEHGPISLVKEASASAKSISKPGERGVANELIGQIVAEANTKEARAELKEHRGPTPQAAIEERVARPRAGRRRVEEAARRRSRAGRGVVPRHRPSGRAVGQVGQPRRTSVDRQARHTVRHDTGLSPHGRRAVPARLRPGLTASRHSRERAAVRKPDARPVRSLLYTPGDQEAPHCREREVGCRRAVHRHRRAAYAVPRSDARAKRVDSCANSSTPRPSERVHRSTSCACSRSRRA